MRRYFITLVLLFTLIAGCGILERDDVSVKAENRELRLTNTSDETVFYVVYPARVLQHMTIVPTCSDENALRGGETKSISYGEVLRTGDDDEAVVYWWRCGEGETQTTIGKAKAIRVPL